MTDASNSRSVLILDQTHELALKDMRLLLQVLKI